MRSRPLSPLQIAAASVARDYAPQLVAAAKRLAAAAPNELAFMQLWTGIAELARSGCLDFTQPQPATIKEENYDG